MLSQIFIHSLKPNKMKPYIKLISSDWIGITDKGWGNGYVVLPKDHPFHGFDYDFLSSFVDVHYGLTYARHEDDGHDGWCVGFDTLHLGDTPEKWPREAVKEETMRLLEQFVYLGEKYTKEKVNQMYGEMHRQSYGDDE
jgi:hypothetical protein